MNKTIAMLLGLLLFVSLAQINSAQDDVWWGKLIKLLFKVLVGNWVEILLDKN